MGRAALVGWAVVGAFAAMVTTFCIIFLSGDGHIFLGSCRVYPLPRICTPLNSWVWAIPIAGIVGAAAGAIGAPLVKRARILLTRAPTIFD
jgi:ribose/xylose/arabinose/galactoside ABC-type transport system permease subunit